MTENLLL